MKMGSPLSSLSGQKGRDDEWKGNRSAAFSYFDMPICRLKVHSLPPRTPSPAFTSPLHPDFFSPRSSRTWSWS